MENHRRRKCVFELLGRVSKFIMDVVVLANIHDFSLRVGWRSGFIFCHEKVPNLDGDFSGADYSTTILIRTFTTFRKSMRWMMKKVK